MSEKPIPFSKRLQWRLEYFAHSVIEFIARLMPGPWVFHLGEALAGVAWHFMPRRRRIVLRNLRIAYCDQMELDEIKQLAKKSFVRAGANLLSSVHTAGLPAEKLSEVLQIENLELLQKFADEGKGVVLLLSHMGNWELLSRLIHFIPEGVALGGMYRPLNNPYMDERVRARRQADGSRMFSKRDSFHQITGFLRGGGVIGVLADQRVGRNGDLIQFFGRLTRASPLPSLLARRAKCDVIALALTTEEPGRWKATFLPVEKPYSTRNCMSALESAMKLGSNDVFWLQERWRVRFKKSRSVSRLLEDGRSAKNKSHRALLWLVGVDDSWRIPDEWTHPDVVYELATEPGRRPPSWLPAATRCHEAPLAGGAGVLEKFIASVDQSSLLPLDLVVAANDADSLVKACKAVAVDLVGLS